MKNNKDNQPPNSTTSRKRVEMKSKRVATFRVPSQAADTTKLLAELQAHQSELEMQNEELRQAQAQLAVEREKYADLYNFAPVGYFTFDENNVILDLNLAAADLLGHEARYLLRRSMTPYLMPASLQTFTQCRETARRTRAPQACELIIRRRDESHVIVEAYTAALKTNSDGRQRFRSVMVDITERKNTENALRESEARFRAVFENSVDAIGVVQKGTLVFANPAYVKMFGYERAAELIGKPVLDVIAPDQRGQIIENARRAAGEMAPLLTETRGIRKDGHQFDIDAHISAYKSGEETFTLVILRDITERKRAEKQMRLQVSAMNAAANSIVITNRDGAIEWVNTAFTAMTGYSFSEAVGNTPRVIKSGMHDKIFYKNMWDVILNGKIWQGDMINRRKDGSLYAEELTITPLMDERGEVERFIAIKQDVTERKQAEEALRKSEEQYRLTIQTAMDGYWLVDAKGNLLDVNERYCQMSGYSKEELLTRSIVDLETAEDVSTAAAHMRKIIELGEDRFESVHRRKDGGFFHVEVSAQYKPIDDGRFVVFLHDITSRKAREKEIERLNRLLVSLSQVNQLAARVQTREELFAGICRVLVESGNFKMAWVGWLDGETRAITPVAHYGDDTDYLQRIQITTNDEPEGRGPTGTSVRENRPDVCNDIRNDPRIAWRELAAQAGFGSNAALPIYLGGNICGVLTFYDAEPDFFGDQEISLLTEVARDVSFALDYMASEMERTRAQEELQKERNELELRIQERTAELKRLSRYNELILNSAGEGIYGIDLKGQTVFVNPAGAALLGYEKEELIGKDQHELTHYAHLDGVSYPHAECPIHLAIQDGEVRRVDDEVFWRKNGASFPVEYVGTPIRDENGTLAGAVVVFKDITERKRAQEQIERQILRLNSLRVIDTAIAGSLDLQLTLKVALEQVMARLEVDAASVLLLNPHTMILEHAAHQGFRGKKIERARLRWGEGHGGRATLERRAIHIPDMTTENFLRAELFVNENFVSYSSVPLVAKGEVKGVLEVFHRAPFHAKDEWLEFLEMLAGQIAIAVDSAQLYTDLQRANHELLWAYDATIESLSRAMDLRDKETEGHSERVTEMTVDLARAVGISDAELAHIRRGALLHDIGKLGIPDSILLKPDKLTPEEWQTMRLHTRHAFDMLSPIAFLRLAVDIPYCHHEKWDGSGYPRGLKGRQIPLGARIFSIVDVYDALTNDRPYRKALPKEEALEYIRASSGIQFDPQIVDAFLKLMS